MKLWNFGPFATAVLSAVVATALMIAVTAGLRIDMDSVLKIFVPGMSLSVLMIAVSMGWIFVLIGRLHRQPRWIAATIVVVGFAMLELLLILIALGRPPAVS